MLKADQQHPPSLRRVRSTRASSSRAYAAVWVQHTAGVIVPNGKIGEIAVQPGERGRAKV